MSSHYKDLTTLFGECVGQSDFESVYTVDDALPFRRLFHLKALLPRDGTNNALMAVVSGSAQGNAFRQAHGVEALRRVCNSVLESKGVRAGVDELRDESEVRLAWRFLGAFGKDDSMQIVVDRSLARTIVDFNYATARPRMFDMFVHLSAGEMFIIDGDSLLMAALSQQHVDWDLMQPLHVLANAQAVLSRLQRRGARFHVVFFDNMKWMWEKAPQKLFIRENLRAALQTVSDTNPTAGLIINNFESFHCDAFVEYVERWDPEFLLISDGEQLGAPNALQALFNNGTEDVEVLEGTAVSAEEAKADVARTLGHVTRHYRSLVDDEVHGDQVAFYYRCFMVWAMSRHIKVAFSSRIVSRENAMLVFALTVDSQQFARCLAIRDRTSELAAELEHEPTTAMAQLGKASLALADDEQLPYVEQITSAAVHAYLKDASRSEQEIQLCQVAMMASYCSAMVGPELRAQRAPASADITQFLNALAPYMLSAFLHKGCLAGRGAEFDIFDGHFIAVLTLLFKTTAPVDLLGADSAGDIDASWEVVVGTKKARATDKPLSALPDVLLATPKTAIAYPHMTHELVERLAATFKVGAHSANRPFPATFGNANKLSGWSVSAPFDELNDVVDTFVEEEAKKNVTVKERRLHMKIETAFVKDATQQAESMGIHGFTTTRLTTAVSDDDEDEEKNQANKPAQKQQHAKQKNQKTRSKNEIIREEANIREANRAVRDGAATVVSLLKTTDLTVDRTTDKARIDAMGTLRAAIRRVSGMQYGRNFDPGEVIVEKDRESKTDEDTAVPLKLAMWRLLVATSGMREAELAFAVSSKNAVPQTSGATNTRKAARAAAAGDDLFGFTVVDQLIEDCTGGHATPSAGSWGKLARLQNVGMTTYDAANFLRFVYLFYVQLHFQAKLMVRLVKLQLDNWKQERERARLVKQSPDLKIGTPLFLYCHHDVLALTRDFGLTLSVDDLDIVRSALVHFEFPAEYYAKIDAAIAQWQNAPVRLLAPAFHPVQRLGELQPAHVQLLHMGHLLERPLIPERDYRVVFNPDAWQRELLDIVDARGSAVVCAPTSAGKTFISYYCMYNALKTSNTKVVVYVAPSRALINQAVADVCARYGSKTYVSLDRNVYGVHGGQDYHRYHDNCQVLVTLPEVLETLLLSPKHKEWTERLDYVILDEIHTMESSGNGDVWERVFALLPCPFVALSATLGETQELCGWLNRVQSRLQIQQADSTKKRDYVVHNIPSSGSIQRWNDIRKYIYLPPAGYRPPPVKKLNAKYDVRHIQDLHPLSILTLDQLRNGFPPDITLVPSEVVQLYQCMKAGFNDTIKPAWSSKLESLMALLSQNLDVLEPEFYFSMETYITQQRARQYEVDVKASYVYWLQVSNGAAVGVGMDALSSEDVTAFKDQLHAMCQTILQSFSQRLRTDEAALNEYATEAAQKQFRLEGKNLAEIAEKEAGHDHGAEESSETAVANEDEAKAAAATATSSSLHSHTMVPFPDSKEFISEHVISVLREIHARDMGPTIVFSFETEDCDQLVKAVVEQLEMAELRYRQTEEFAQYKAMMERKAAAQAAALKQRESSMKGKRLTKDEDGTVDRADRNVDMAGETEEDFTIPDVLPEFTFIGLNRSVDVDTVKSAIAHCVKNGDDLAARAIQRGVGIHHAGVKGKLRRQMEILFRGRHCGVIFATETLALGVHSPCRSVVLAGDHVLLNTTQFRQMMGRAGRRGLDFLGHLIFLSISMKKITRLMTSSMTVIKGNVQVNPITQLRLLQLFDYQMHRETPRHPEPWKQYALSLAERLYANPLFFEGRAQVEGGNMEPFTIEMMQMVLGYFQKEGLHFKDRPSSLGSLLVDAMHIFRNAGVGADGFSFISMLTRDVFNQASFSGAYAYLNSGVYGPIPADSVTADLEASHPVLKRMPCTEAVAEVMAYLCTVNRMCGVPMELHRSALSDPVVMELWVKKPNMRQHRVVLAPLRVCTTDTSTPVFDNKSAFRVISAFYTFLASTLQTPATRRLPYMSGKTRVKNPIFPGKTKCSSELCEKLTATAVPFAARDMFVALSGCGDHFANTDDLVQTMRNGLFCDRNMLPFVDLVDGCRHDGAQVLINACVADFVRCKAQIDSASSNYRFTLLEELNGLSQSESFATLEYAERLLSNVAGLVRNSDMEHLKVLEALFPEEDTPGAYYAGAPQVLNFCHLLHQLHSQIVLDLAGDQMRARFEEATRKREAAKEDAAAKK